MAIECTSFLHFILTVSPLKIYGFPDRILLQSPPAEETKEGPLLV